MNAIKSAAPSVVDCRIIATLSGFVLKVGQGPSASDPLGQHTHGLGYATLDEALDDLPAQIRKYITEQQG